MVLQTENPSTYSVYGKLVCMKLVDLTVRIFDLLSTYSLSNQMFAFTKYFDVVREDWCKSQVWVKLCL